MPARVLTAEAGAGDTIDSWNVEPGSDAQVLVRITYYTDPLCSWSWAFEAAWRRFRYETRGLVAWRYCMGGMIADWRTFSDPLNTVGRPAQMGPHWLEVSRLSQMPIDGRLWHEDPPASSYPACVAFKAVERQGAVVAEAYLRRLREAAMIERRNVSRREVLLELAGEIMTDGGCVAFDLEQFIRDLEDPGTWNAFRRDLQDVSYRDVGRFPTLILRHIHGPALIIVGYRPYLALREAFDWLAPGLPSSGSTRDPVAYASYWGQITAQEVTVGLDLPADDVNIALENGVRAGRLRQVLRGDTAVFVAAAG
jgi:putative protein-disulfide isomerase